MEKRLAKIVGYVGSVAFFSLFAYGIAGVWKLAPDLILGRLVFTSIIILFLCMILYKYAKDSEKHNETK